MTEPTYSDYPVAELRARAEQELRRCAERGVPAVVHFKATCPKCGERPMFSEPNTIYEEMECSECGHQFPFVAGNFMLMLGVQPPRERQQ